MLCCRGVTCLSLQFAFRLLRRYSSWLQSNTRYCGAFLSRGKVVNMSRDLQLKHGFNQKLKMLLSKEEEVEELTNEFASSPYTAEHCKHKQGHLLWATHFHMPDKKTHFLVKSIQKYFHKQFHTPLPFSTVVFLPLH